MMEDKYAQRILTLTGHFAVASSRPGGLQTEECAATQVSSFARAAPSGARFARPAQQSFSRDERVKETALLYGSGPMQEAAGRHNATLSENSSKAPAASGEFNKFHSVKGWTPQVHLLSRRSGSLYVFLLPGVKPGDIKLQVKGKCLVLSGKRLQGIIYKNGQNQSRSIAIQADYPAVFPGKAEMQTLDARPVLDEGQFEAKYILPEGDLRGMKATFSNERLRVFLPRLSN